MAIRESIEAEIRKEKEFRENPDIVRTLLNISMELNFDNGHLWGTMFWPLYRGGLC